MRSKRDISYLRMGSGEPLLLVHGLGSRKEVWNPLLNRLVLEREVIAVDLPGFGDSPLLADTAASVWGYVDTLLDFMEELRLDTPQVAGNSMGGGIALELARRGAVSKATAFSPIGFWRAPERELSGATMAGLRRIGKIAGPVLRPVIDTKPVRATFLPFYGKPAGVTREQILVDFDGYVDSPGFPSARRSFRKYRFVRGEELDGVPVTVVWGTHDYILYFKPQAARAKAALPAARFIDLPGAGHVPFADAPEDCVETLLS